MVVYLARRIKMGESAWLSIEAVTPSFRAAHKRELRNLVIPRCAIAHLGLVHLTILE
jgi:hypothetical protein